MSLCDLARGPENVAGAISTGIIASLGKLLPHKNTVVRQKATEALLHFSGHAVGRTAILAENLLEPLMALFDDEIEVVRHNTHACLERCATAADVAASLVAAGFVPKFVAKLDVYTKR